MLWLLVDYKSKKIQNKLFYYNSVSLSEILFIGGNITKAIGKATIKPTIKLFSHALKKPGTKPTFIQVRIKDIKKDMARDINMPNTTL